MLSCRTCGDGSFAVVAVLLSFVEKQLLLLYKVTATAGVGGAATAGATAPPPPPTLTHIKTLYPPQVRQLTSKVVVDLGNASKI